jgi:pyruvate/2-oxoacid:ferredoxin oxidoreductase alpha subunit
MTCDTAPLQGRGVSFALSEAERVWPAILEDAITGDLRPLYGQDERPPVVSFIAGLGGREVTIPAVKEMIEHTRKAAETGRPPRDTLWIGVRE